MRRKDREITGRENIEPILQACKVCRVAMTGTDGWPYTDAALSVTEVMRVRAESFEASRKAPKG